MFPNLQNFKSQKKKRKRNSNTSKRTMSSSSSSQSANELVDEHVKGDDEPMDNQDKHTKTEQEDDGLVEFCTPPKMDGHSEDGDALNDGTPEKEMNNANAGVTPAITKLRQSRTEFKVFSPSDQMFSPCTRKIEKNKLAGPFSQPQVFRSRPPLLPPSKVSAALSTIGCSTVGNNKMRNTGTVAPVCTPQRLSLDEEEGDGAKAEQKQPQQKDGEGLVSAEDGEVDN